MSGYTGLGAPSSVATAGNASMSIGTGLDSQLMQLLNSEAICPGDSPSYQLCKTIYAYHPLGAKMVDGPIRMAQSQEREISVPGSPESRVVDAFKAEWAKIRADDVIAATARAARIYGIGSLAVVVKNQSPGAVLNLASLQNVIISFNVLDPLNTSGSLVLSQDPNSPGFLKAGKIQVAGIHYDATRTCTLLNEEPIYLEYSTSAFGYVGRSVYQRALYPLKSFIQTMRTDDMVSQKAGLLIAAQKQAGSIVDGIRDAVSGIKRQLLQMGATGNVLSIGAEDRIESLNLQNIDGAGKFARDNILKNIAAAADIHASFLNQETLTEGFGEGTEDAKNIARQIDRMRMEMRPIYEFMDRIVMWRAWTPEFFERVQAEFPAEMRGLKYDAAFVMWQNAFVAAWPNMLKEPDSELAKYQKTAFDAMIQTAQVLLPICDPDNKAIVAQWLADNMNQQKLLFPNPLELDAEALAAYEPPQPEAQGEGGGQSKNDSVGHARPVIRLA